MALPMKGTQERFEREQFESDNPGASPSSSWALPGNLEIIIKTELKTELSRSILINHTF